MGSGMAGNKDEGLLTVDRYGIDECLAAGELGTLFRGYDPLLHRPVAINIPSGESGEGSRARGLHEQFKRKARAAAQLLHPNIPTIFDFGEHNGLPFVAMEYVDGSTLDKLLKIAGPFAPQRAIVILLQILAALQCAHENRVVHLDLKPSTVLVGDDDQIKVAGFGVALVNTFEHVPDDLALPLGGNMAPEQLTGAVVDHRTDLFAAGALLFEMLTGMKPFPGRTIADILAQMENAGPDDVCKFNVEVSRALRSTIETALAYDPAQRFPSASVFSCALNQTVSEAEPTRLPPSRAATHEKYKPPIDHSRWNPDLLDRMVADLATYIGPIAATVVRRAAARAENLSMLSAKSCRSTSINGGETNF